MKKRIVCCGVFFFFFCVSFAAAGGIENVDIHGFMSQGYMSSSANNYLADTENGTFEFNELGINFSTTFDNLRIGAQILSRDLGEFGNNEAILDWAVGDYRISNEFGIRIGKVKMPMGLYNQGRDVDFLRMSVFLPTSIYDEGSRDFQNTFQGGEVYGIVEVSGAGEFDYELFGGTVNVDSNSIFVRGRSDSIEAAVQGSTISNLSSTSRYIAGGAVRWSPPLDGLRAGFSYNYNNVDVTADLELPVMPGVTITSPLEIAISKRTTWVASLEYEYENLTLAGEYAQIASSGELRISALGPLGTSAFDGTNEGWYLQASYRFLDQVAAGIYYSEYYPERNDKDGKELSATKGFPEYYAWQKEIVPTVRFDIGNSWEIKAEAHFIDGAAQVYSFNNPNGKDKDWQLYALKATFNY